MKEIPPIEAVRGKALNDLADTYLLRAPAMSQCKLPELMQHYSNLLYLNQMQEKGELRISTKERTALWKQINYVKRLIAEAEKCPFTQEEIKNMPIWMRQLLYDSEIQLAIDMA